MAGGKLKSGKKTKNTKGKRWKKGHSSDSNPQLKKHRNIAKDGFFKVQSGSSDLTVDALAKHNRDFDIDDDNQSIKTFGTWQTDCTNASFNKVYRFSGNTAQHKEILAVLAAVTEVIRQQGGQESETAYFGALMTCLSTVEEEASVAAIVYLLGLVIKRTPPAVLKKKFSETSKALVDVLTKYTESTSLIRSVLLCLASLLRVQDAAAWSPSSTTALYATLLSFITHPKPKVRQASHQAVRVVLRASTFMLAPETAPAHHPAAKTTAEHCIHLMERASLAAGSGGGDSVASTLHVLGLLQHILGLFPHQSLKAMTEAILTEMARAKNVLVTSVALKTLHGMFSLSPKSSCLPADLNVQIIKALYDFQPGEQDSQPLAAWLAVMEKAHTNLAKLRGSLCLSHLPQLFSVCRECLQTDSDVTRKHAANTLNTMVTECLKPLVSSSKQPGSDTALSSQLVPLFRVVEAGLSYQYIAGWAQVLSVIATFFQHLGGELKAACKKCLLSLANLRGSDGFPYKAELDHAVGMAVRTMGPKVVLDAVPLQITGDDRDDYSFPRSWLLPVIRDHVRETELAYFADYFLPLAAKLRDRSLAYEKEGRTVEAKSYDALQYQIWTMLPGFATKPTDLTQSFKSVAKVLGAAIQDRPDLRLDVMASLRRLINNSLDRPSDKAEMGRFAKNYIPLLFNLFTAEPENMTSGAKDSTRLAMLETVKVYLQVADTSLINTFFDKCVSKMAENDVSTFRKHALMDLAITMLPYVDTARLQQMYPHVTQQLASTDPTVQKKSYRLLEEMVSGKSAACTEFVASCLSDLQIHLLKNLSAAKPSAKAPRLRCLVHIVHQLEKPQMPFVEAVIPEAMLCTKELAEKARLAAYSLLVSIGNALLRWRGCELPSGNQPAAGGGNQSGEDATMAAAEAVGSGDVLREYLTLLLAGLAGSPHMVTCTVLALTRVVYEFKAIINSDLLAVLADTVCVLLSNKAREIVNATMGLLKVVLSIFPESMLAQHLDNLVGSLVSMREDNKHHFRFRAKEIYARLIRKFGYDVIASKVPESHHKILGNIRKTMERAKKKKAAAAAEDEEEEEETGKAGRPETIEDLLRETDSEMEDDDDDKKQTKSGGKKQKLAKKDKSEKQKPRSSSAWINEGGEDIVDFLDPAANKKVMATRPGVEAGKKRGIDHEFKTSADGRLIITEDSSDDEDEGKNGQKPVIDDVDELLDALGGPGKRKAKKRKMVDDDEDEEMTYKPGGSGIHRPLGQQTAPPPMPGAEYRAKKAKGDVKRAGKPDPYAYVQLNMSNLNRRKRAKNKGEFNSLVRGAKKGAQKGAKMRGKGK